MVKKKPEHRFCQFGFHWKEALVMKIMGVTILLFWSRETCEHALSWGKEDRNHKEMARNKTEEGKWYKGLTLSTPLLFCFPFRNVPQQEACSLWDVPHFLRKKLGEEIFFSWFLSKGGGMSVHRLEAYSGWFFSSGWKTHAQGLKHSQHTDKRKKESLEGKFNAHFAHLRAKNNSHTINCLTWLPSR